MPLPPDLYKRHLQRGKLDPNIFKTLQSGINSFHVIILFLYPLKMPEN